MQTSTKLAQESGCWKVLASSSSQIRYGSVNWSFDTPRNNAKPPHYHGSLLRTSRPRRRYAVFWNARPFGPSPHPTTLPHDPTEEWSRSDCLNPQFIAVSLAEHVLQTNEVDVGFPHSDIPDISLDQSDSSRVKLSDDVDEAQVQLGRSQWAVLARDLIGDIHLSISTHDIDGVARPQSPLSSLEYDSEPSTDSDLPRTPTQKSTFSRVEVQLSPALNTRSLPPRKALNGSARAFSPKSGPPSKRRSLVPSSSDLRSSSDSSPTPLNFTFPAINSNYQYLPQSLKDDKGFYTSISSSARLPHFMPDAQSRSRNASKTRVIVDQMKAVPGPGKKGRSRNHPEPPSEAGNSPSESSVSSCDTGVTKKSELTQGGDRGQDPDAALVSVGNRKKELPSSPSKVTSATAAGSSVQPAPGASFLMQPPVTPFYTMSHTPAYPYPCVLGSPSPPVTSWVAIPPPAYPNVIYTRPVMVHATW